MCIDQLLDSITLVAWTKPQLECDVVVNVDKDRPDRHDSGTKVCEWSYDGSSSPGTGHRNCVYGSLMSAYMLLKVWDIWKCLENPLNKHRRVFRQSEKPRGETAIQWGRPLVSIYDVECSSFELWSRILPSLVIFCMLVSSFDVKFCGLCYDVRCISL